MVFNSAFKVLSPRGYLHTKETSDKIFNNKLSKAVEINKGLRQVLPYV